MMRDFLLRTMAVLLVASGCMACHQRQQTDAAASTEGDTATSTPEACYANAIYYWKSTSDSDYEEAELAFLAKHDIGRVYVRFFDVVDNPEHGVVPSAELSARCLHLRNANVDIVPTIFITQEAMRYINGNEEEVAFKIHNYIVGMCKDLDVNTLREVQLDCDWTATTRAPFFRLCRALGDRLHPRGQRITSTIRLHQLSQPAPPVDGGVLMVYNVGSLKDPKAKNSIIDASVVKQYLKGKCSYALPLDVAYPVFAWQVLFCDGQFQKLRHIDSEDEDDEGKVYTVRKEYSDYQEVMRAKAVVEKYLDGKPHHNILYHLDAKQLSRYTDQQIHDLYE